MMNTESKESRTVNPSKLWTLPFLNIMSINSFITLTNSMVMQALPLYVMALGSSEAVAGLPMTFFTISSLLCRPFFGNMVDQRGRKLTLLVGCCIYAATCLCFRIAPIVLLLILIRSVQGLGNSAYSTAAGTIVADIVPPERMTEGVGYYGISYNIANAFGPSLMLLISGLFGYSAVFLISSGISVVAIALTMVLSDPSKHKVAPKATPAIPVSESESAVTPISLSAVNMIDQQPIAKEKKKIRFESIVEKTAIPGALVMVLTGCPLGFTNSFLVKFGQTLGIDSIGWYFTVNAVAMLLSRLFIGRICDRIGAQRALPPGLLLIFCGVATIAISRSLPAFLIAAMFMGFGYGILNPTIQAFTLKSAPAHRKGAASATYYSAIDIGNGIGSLLGGILSQTIGFASAFGCYTFFVVGASLMFVFVLRKKILANAK